VKNGARVLLIQSYLTKKNGMKDGMKELQV